MQLCQARSGTVLCHQSMPKACRTAVQGSEASLRRLQPWHEATRWCTSNRLLKQSCFVRAVAFCMYHERGLKEHLEARRIFARSCSSMPEAAHVVGQWLNEHQVPRSQLCVLLSNWNLVGQNVLPVFACRPCRRFQDRRRIPNC